MEESYHTYRIAGVTIRMRTFGRTAAQSEPYRVPPQETVDFVMENDVAAWQKDYPTLTADECEYLSTGAFFYRRLPVFGGMMLHASAVVADGKAYLFSAPSGTGKSTHTALWQKLLGDRAYLINDDKPALCISEDGHVYVYGTPWSGKTAQNRNERVELGAICVLRRGTENSIRRLSVEEALPALLDQTQRSAHPAATAYLLQVLDKLLRLAPVYGMECLPDLAAAEMAYRAMAGGEKSKGNSGNPLAFPAEM